MRSECYTYGRIRRALVSESVQKYPTESPRAVRTQHSDVRIHDAVERVTRVGAFVDTRASRSWRFRHLWIRS